jgi:atypical dual specificity phosphatase
MPLAIPREALMTAGDAPPARPHTNTYWLLPGRLLAGEHPHGGHTEALALRLQGFRAAGVSCFIDLTGESDGPAAYTPLPLSKGGAGTGAGAAKRLPMAIADFGVPSIARMREVLDAIDAALAAGETVYLHCRAGVGRTGTVAGCWLVEQGFAPDAALALLQHKWRAMAKSAFVRQTPETGPQRAFVAAWSPGKGRAAA